MAGGRSAGLSSGEARMVQTELWGDAGSAGAVLDREPGFQPTGGGALGRLESPVRASGLGFRKGPFTVKGAVVTTVQSLLARNGPRD